MKILFTGASSFTGYWFVRALAQAGHEVVCAVTGPVDCYEGTRRQRVEQLRSICHFVPDAPFGTDAFLKLIRSGRWDLLCHHGAGEMANYRRPDFDVQRALHKNTLNLSNVLSTLRDNGGKGVVLTGTVFENDEGIGEKPLRAFSPYGLAKGLTYQAFRSHCAVAGVSLGKFVIPNPFGPFEELRFTAHLMKMWRDGKAAVVKTPDYVRDNIHADLLASVYVKFAGRVANSREGLLKSNPSGYAETQGNFAKRVAREVRSRLGWVCELELAKQEDFSEPLKRVNFESAAASVPDWNERVAWDDFVGYYNQK